ncbi:hypothetical protein B0O80DRAFT_429586 [Mortierella sp. GBAus27b]|nr:hypothetical protein B0O80DRAFT_429586 [Mortierella sp. GBAus27b]
MSRTFVKSTFAAICIHGILTEGVSFYRPLDEQALMSKLQSDADPDPDPEASMVAILIKTISEAVFGFKRNKVEIKAVEYIVQLEQDKPQAEAFMAFIKLAHPSARKEAMTRAWEKIRDFFGGQNEAQYESIQGFIDVTRMVTLFKDTTSIENAQENGDKGGSQATNALRRPSSPETIGTSTSGGDSNGDNSTSTGSGSTSYGSNSVSTGSSSNLSPTVITKMRSAFHASWSSYSGEGWVLPSESSLDDLLKQYILELNYESTLHSFIISDVEDVIRLAEDPRDKDQLALVLNQQRDDKVWKLAPTETKFVDLYCKSPVALKEILRNGCNHAIAEALKDGEPGQLDENFCDSIHHIVDRYHRIYQRNLWRLPSGKSESWYRENVWWILGDLFNEPEVIAYEPGEHHSKASSHRKNCKRKSSNELQQVGRKMDGIIICCSPELELGAMEAAKADNGMHSTKALSDTIKLAKVMKDQFDRVHQSTVVDALEHITTYGIRVSGGSVFFYTMHHRRGRWYQFTCEGAASFPEVWKQDGNHNGGQRSARDGDYDVLSLSDRSRADMM